jgi:PKHD-type hydroxylase
MLLRIPSILTAEQVSECVGALRAADWTDGKDTAGYLSRQVKDNEQLHEGHPLARKLGGMILDELDKNQLFISGALPLKVVPPLFNRYAILWRPCRRGGAACVRHASSRAHGFIRDAVSLGAGRL